MSDKRKSDRVIFERGFVARMMGVDGTWQRKCKLLDVSSTGALLQVEKSVAGLDLKEFFLLLSAAGLAFRRGRLVWLDGGKMGIEFISGEAKSVKPKVRRLSGGARNTDRDNVTVDA